MIRPDGVTLRRGRGFRLDAMMMFCRSLSPSYHTEHKMHGAVPERRLPSAPYGPASRHGSP